MSIIAIGLCIYYLKFYIKKKILFKKKRFNIIILIIIITAFFIPFLISKNKIKNHEKEDEINKVEVHYYCYRSSSSFYDSSDNTKYTIPSKGVYSICVYGAKAKEGGRGGKICGDNYFDKDSIIECSFGGQTAGGEGGKGCGFWENGNGNNGAGYSMAKYGAFIVIAGGGGGDSEGGYTKGGDAEKEGEGLYKGLGAKRDKGGLGGNKDSEMERGTLYHGGKGESSGKRGKYCPGGGGDGYYGGGAGHWGVKGEAGGGGGGSNYCLAQYCSISELNTDSDYSCIKIFAIKQEKNIKLS